MCQLRKHPTVFSEILWRSATIAAIQLLPVPQMIHNDILRRLRYALNFNDAQMIATFKLANYEINNSFLAGIMKREEEEGFMLCRDSVLSLFLDGLIIKKRGKKEGQEPVVLKPNQRLSNNEILRKLRIAFTFKDQDIIDTMKLAGLNVSKSELSALFRAKNHRNYMECQDQFLRLFLNGLTKRLNPKAS